MLDDRISKHAEEKFVYIAPKYNITLQERKHDKEYVHILFKAHPNTEIRKLLNTFKSASTMLLKGVSANNEKAKVYL